MLLELQPTQPKSKLSPPSTPKKPPEQKPKLKPPPLPFKRTFNKPSMILSRNKRRKMTEKKQSN